AQENDRARAVRKPPDRRSGLGGRTVQQTRHLLFEAVVERFLRRGLGVGTLAARAFRGFCGGCRLRFVARRYTGLALPPGRGARVVELARAPQPPVRPRGGPRPREFLALRGGRARCLGRGRRGGGVLALARTSQRGL